MLYSRCCAQTAAPKGKKHKRWEMETRGHRSIKSSTQRSARSVVTQVTHNSATKACGKEPTGKEVISSGPLLGGDEGGEASHARGVLAIAQVATNIPKSRPKAP